jgi:hypothetical protein
VPTPCVFSSLLAELRRCHFAPTTTHGTDRGDPGSEMRLDPLGAALVGRLPVRFGASKRAENYRGRLPPLINRALAPRGAFFDPIPRLEAPEAPYSPAKRAIFFYWCLSGARPGQPARGAAAPRRGGSGGGDWPGCSGLFWRAPPRALAPAHCIEIFF